ncbi:MFS transporter [Bacillus atrophaeus]|uniref:MFS transporter n=1 Tax=Bacillus atrophaeus TaxID=1452 RepID=UPI000B92B589|nr:MFS transporter [Bacillus atrophaeus]ASS70031.1 MFS transporter [Bacillus atrophaeus]
MSKGYYSILFSQTTTNLGFSLYTMVVISFLFKMTNSTTIASLVTLISIIFRIFGSAILPLITIQLKLHLTLIISQLIQILLLTCLFYFLLRPYSYQTIILVFIIISSISFFNGWFSPLKSALIGEIVPSDKRVKANGLLSTVDQTFQFVGWSLGGLIISLLGEGYTIIITILLLLISLFFLLFCLNTKQNGQTNPVIPVKSSPFKSLVSGWRYLFNQKQLRTIIIMDLIESWAGMIWIGSVSLAFVDEVLHKGESWWGYINGAYYLGSMIGGFIIYKLSERFQNKLIHFMLIGAFSYGTLTLIYGFISNAYLALLLVIFMGPAYILRDLTQETFIQNITTEQTRINIMSARSSLVQFIFMFSILGIGIISDLLGVRLVYVSAGILLLASALYGFSQLQFKRKVNKHISI